MDKQPREAKRTLEEISTISNSGSFRASDFRERSSESLIVLFDSAQKEEIDWIGLTPDEAVEKLENEEKENYEKSIRPWKELYKESLVLELSRRMRNNEPMDITPVSTKA